MSTEETDIAALCETVQRNCDLADAFHAQSVSLCAYLMDMREYFRWSRGLPLEAALAKAEIGAWISSREAVWESLREAAADGPELAFESLLPLSTAALPELADVFDEAALDVALAPLGLVAGAGLGRFGRPLFFLAERLRTEQRDGLEIVIAGRELARGVTAPPAVSRDGRVTIRLDAFERWLWARFEEWRHHPHEGSLVAAFAAYADEAGCAEVHPGHCAEPATVIRRMAAAECETLILHELGEQRAGALLGDDWHDMLDDGLSRKAEVFLRSARDLYADCATTLPTLLGRDARASVHGWFALLEGPRRMLAPALVEAYGAWCGGDETALPAALASGEAHWLAASEALCEAWRREGVAAIEAAALTPEGYQHPAAAPL